MIIPIGAADSTLMLRLSDPEKQPQILRLGRFGDLAQDDNRLI